MRLASILFFLRSLPAGPRRWAAARASRRRPLLDVLTATPGFLHLEGPAEGLLAFGYVGRPWTPSGGGRRLTREEYLAFDEPGYAKVATDFRGGAGGSGIAAEHDDPHPPHRRQRPPGLRPLLAAGEVWLVGGAKELAGRGAQAGGGVYSQPAALEERDHPDQHQRPSRRR